jgi:hypothetical protein
MRSSFALLLAWVALAPLGAYASPWVKPPGRGYAGVRVGSFTVEQADRYFQTRIHADILGAAGFFAVGLPGRLELSADVPYLVATNVFTAKDTYRNHSLGDARVQVKRALSGAPPLSLALEAQVPLYRTIREQQKGGVVEVGDGAYAASNFPDVGQGHLVLTPKLSIGRSFHPDPAWATLDLGYRARLGKVADGLYASAGLGGWVWRDKVAIGVSAGGQLRVGEDPNPVVARATEYLHLAGSVMVAPPWVKGLGFKVWAGTLLLARYGDTGTDLGASMHLEY